MGVVVYSNVLLSSVAGGHGSRRHGLREQTRPTVRRSWNELARAL